jgi:hypothetical protein
LTTGLGSCRFCGFRLDRRGGARSPRALDLCEHGRICRRHRCRSGSHAHGRRRGIRIRRQPQRGQAHGTLALVDEFQVQVHVVRVDGTQRRHVQELAAVAPRHRQIQAGQQGRRGDAGAVIDLRTGDAYLHGRGGVVEHRQLDVGHERLADVRRHARVAQLGRMDGGKRGQSEAGEKKAYTAGHGVEKWGFQRG